MRAKALLFAVFFLALALSAHAATFSCTIRASSSCNAGETLFIRLNSSEAGAAPNNSHAQMPNSTATAYGYSVCCSTDAFRTLSNTCSATSTTVLKLYNQTDSHVQAGTQSGYSYTACLNVTYGNITCEYPNSACSAGFSQMISIASSEAGDNNLTNAHVADFNLYTRKVCCQIGGQNPPVVAFANITPNPTANTRNTLTCANGTVSDADGDTVTLHYNWYRNGTSITVLNLPMDYDSANGVTHDISSRGNHATVGTATFTPTGGKVGGAFTLANGSSLNATTGLYNLTNITIVTWVNPTAVATKNVLLSIETEELFELTTNQLTYYPDTNLAACTSSAFTYTGNAWMQVAVVYSYTTNNCTFYLNGTYLSSTTGPSSPRQRDFSTVVVGHYDANRYLNGTIDEFMIFNRSLDSSEMAELYTLYNKNLNNTELRRQDRWNCSITPIDSTGLNGTTKYSNQTNVSGSAPLAPVLLYPINGNTTAFERFMNFSWSNEYEPDGDAVTYSLNMSLQPGTCTVQTNTTGITTTNYTQGELCVDQYYNWTVTACDIEGCNTSSKSNFTIASVLSVVLRNNNTNFGVLGAGQSKDTELGGVAPFLIENDGNVRANITLNATNSPFTLAALGSTAFQYKARVNETGAFNTTGSQLTYVTVDAVLKHAVKQLQYNDTNDTVYIDINITVPAAEPPGSKTTNVTFRAVDTP